ncbi:MAG: type II secretion system protein [Planctomycetes bacterium]|nr:type II secretion system protein [Planctomycetota bacterium]
MTKLIANTAARKGFSFLELQVAFVLLGIALAGLVPLVVMQSKQLKRIEDRLSSQTTHYLAPSDSLWARKLGVPATIQATDPGSPSYSKTEDPVQDVSILSIDRTLTSEEVGARVQVTEISIAEDLESQ